MSMTNTPGTMPTTSYSHAGDALFELEARLSFVECAALAFSERPDSFLPPEKAWAGLHFITLDLLDIIKQANATFPLA